MLCGALRTFIPSEGWLRDSTVWIHRAIPVPYGMTFAVSIILAVVLGHAGNGMLWARQRLSAPHDNRRVSVWAYWRSMSEHVTALDDLMRRAVLEDEQVLLCLKSRKVYCGIVSEIRGNYEAGSAHVQLIPSFSITRDKDTLKFCADTRTEYRAYRLKRAFDRKESLDRMISRTVGVIRFVRERRSDSPQSERGEATDVMDDLKVSARGLIRERRVIRRLLAQFGVDGRFDVTEWVKVIPIAEVESASLYKDDDADRWFVQAEASEEAGA